MAWSDKWPTRRKSWQRGRAAAPTGSGDETLHRGPEGCHRHHYCLDVIVACASLLKTNVIGGVGCVGGADAPCPASSYNSSANSTRKALLNVAAPSADFVPSFLSCRAARPRFSAGGSAASFKGAGLTFASQYGIDHDRATQRAPCTLVRVPADRLDVNSSNFITLVCKCGGAAERYGVMSFLQKRHNLSELCRWA